MSILDNLNQFKVAYIKESLTKQDIIEVYSLCQVCTSAPWQ